MTTTFPQSHLEARLPRSSTTTTSTNYLQILVSMMARTKQSARKLIGG